MFHTSTEEAGQLLAKHHGKFACFSTQCLIHAWTVAMRTSLCDKEIWKLSKDRTVRLQYFEKIAQYIYCCDPYYDKAFTVPSLPFLRLHVIYCHFCFFDKPSERRTCIISKLDGLKSRCVVNVKDSAIFEPFKDLSKDYTFLNINVHCYNCYILALQHSISSLIQKILLKKLKDMKKTGEYFYCGILMWIKYCRQIQVEWLQLSQIRMIFVLHPC